MNLGLHELGPLACQSTRPVRINSTCTVFAGAELRERLSLGEKREDILAGLHRAIILRAMSLLARSGGVADEFTFTGGVAQEPGGRRRAREAASRENYGERDDQHLARLDLHRRARRGALRAARRRAPSGLEAMRCADATTDPHGRHRRRLGRGQGRGHRGRDGDGGERLLAGRARAHPPPRPAGGRRRALRRAARARRASRARRPRLRRHDRRGRDRSRSAPATSTA